MVELYDRDREQAPWSGDIQGDWGCPGLWGTFGNRPNWEGPADWMDRGSQWDRAQFRAV
jgi:hypothetical protein